MTIQEKTKIDRKLQRNDELIVASVDDELVMLSVEKGQYFGVSGVGIRIWELLESPRSELNIIEIILNEFQVDEVTCRRDVGDFLDQMLELELVTSE